MGQLCDSGNWREQADCLRRTIRKSVLFSCVEAKQFEQIHQMISVYALPTGSLLYRTGDKANQLFTIRCGMLKLIRRLPDGSQRIVRLLHEGDIAGLESLVGDSYRHDAVVVKPVEACSLPVCVVQALSLTSAALDRELFARWQQALQEADIWLTELSTGSARQRIARLLLYLARHDKRNECTLLSCEDMGSILSITEGTASRNIADFKRRHILTGTGTKNRFTVDEQRLTQIAEHEQIAVRQ